MGDPFALLQFRVLFCCLSIRLDARCCTEKHEVAEGDWVEAMNISPLS
jgi:hypothetical protein